MAAANPNADLAGFEELDPPFTHAPSRIACSGQATGPPPSVSAAGWRPAGSESTRELPGGSAFDPPHATLTTKYEQAPDNPDEPTRRWFEEVVGFLRERLQRP